MAFVARKKAEFCAVEYQGIKFNLILVISRSQPTSKKYKQRQLSKKPTSGSNLSLVHPIHLASSTDYLIPDINPE